MLNDDSKLAERAAATGHALSAAGLCMACAESCTGGWIAKLATDISGSSAWFERGFVTYSNAAKEQLGVDAAVIEHHGAVSAETVAAMAASALRASGADAALAVSGIAGPGGGSVAKPVGTVWLAWALREAGAEDTVTTRLCQFDGDRDAVRRAAVVAAFDGLLALLKSVEKR